MALHALLQTIRERLSFWWIVILFSLIYMISQASLGALLENLGAAEVFRLQVTGFSATTYLDTFERWEASGAMPAYRAHLIIDGIHWLWYTIALTALLAKVLERSGSPDRYNLLLLMPLIAGPCDVLENTIQEVFLSDTGYVTVIDPLPLISSVASITKWSLAAVTLVAVLALAIRRPPPGG